MKAKKFPKVIYIKRENADDPENEYLGTFEDMNSAAEDEPTAVAVYELKQVLRLKKEVVQC